MNRLCVRVGGALLLGLSSVLVVALPACGTASGPKQTPLVAAGEDHSLAVENVGTLWAWRYNGHGQLGDGTTTSSSALVQVTGLTNITAIAAGENHSLALKSDGSVWARGDYTEGQLGDGSTGDHSDTPVQVADLP
jgi:alpha-tubulin suppressor-like RCC1 family protein